MFCTLSKGKMLYFALKFCVFQYTNSTCIRNYIFRVNIKISSRNVCHNIKKIALKNDTKHDRACKSVTEIKDHAKNFPNALRNRGSSHFILKMSSDMIFPKM